MKKLLLTISFLIIASFSFAALEVSNDGGASNITSTSAWINVSVTDTGAAAPVLFAFWGTNDRSTNLTWSYTNNFGVCTVDTYTIQATNLSIGTRYYYRAYATNLWTNTAWSSYSRAFKTLDSGTTAPPASVQTVTVDTNGILKNPTNFFAVNGISTGSLSTLTNAFYIDASTNILTGGGTNFWEQGLGARTRFQIGRPPTASLSGFFLDYYYTHGASLGLLSDETNAWMWAAEPSQHSLYLYWYEGATDTYYTQAIISSNGTWDLQSHYLDSVYVHNGTETNHPVNLQQLTAYAGTTNANAITASHTATNYTAGAGDVSAHIAGMDTKFGEYVTFTNSITNVANAQGYFYQDASSNLLWSLNAGVMTNFPLTNAFATGIANNASTGATLTAAVAGLNLTNGMQDAITTTATNDIQRLEGLIEGLGAVDLYGATNTHPVIANAKSLFSVAPATTWTYTNALAEGTNFIGTFLYTNTTDYIRDGTYDGVFWASTTSDEKVKGYIELITVSSDGVTTNTLGTSQQSAYLFTDIRDRLCLVPLGTAQVVTNVYLGVNYYLVKEGVPAVTAYTYGGDGYGTKLGTPGLGTVAGYVTDAEFAGVTVRTTTWNQAATDATGLTNSITAANGGATLRGDLNMAGNSITNANSITITNQAFKFSETADDNIGIESVTYPIGPSQTNSVWMGYAALSQSPGSQNSAMGNSALYLSPGSFNSAMGNFALSLSPGSQNSAMGRFALYQSSGSDNAAVGNSALYLSPGSYNAAVGRSALRQSPGSYNFAGGYQAGYKSGGSSNVFLGANAGYTAGATTNYYTNAIAVGAGAVPLGNNSAVLGNAQTTTTELKGNVGIGTNLPAATLDVNGGLTVRGAQTNLGNVVVSGDLSVAGTSYIYYASTTNYIARWSTGVGEYYVQAMSNGTLSAIVTNTMTW